MTWQKIETAPEDGTFILGINEGDWPEMAVIAWDKEKEYWWWGEYTFYPTHWMPLPPPPEEAI